MIKKNHSKKKNCDISNLCIELVVKEMSQRDVSSRRGAALLKERLPSYWRCIMPAIRTLYANIKAREQRGDYSLSETGGLQTTDQNPLQSSVHCSKK